MAQCCKQLAQARCAVQPHCRFVVEHATCSVPAVPAWRCNRLPPTTLPLGLYTCMLIGLPTHLVPVCLPANWAACLPSRLASASGPRSALPGCLHAHLHTSPHRTLPVLASAPPYLPGLLAGWCMQIILPPLFGKLDTLPDGDKELVPLMECLTTGEAGHDIRSLAV